MSSDRQEKPRYARNLDRLQVEDLFIYFISSLSKRLLPSSSQADIVVVLEQDRLYSQLVTELKVRASYSCLPGCASVTRTAFSH